MTLAVLALSTGFVLVGTLAVMAYQSATYGIRKTQQKFSHQAISKADRPQRRMMTYAFPVALATWIVLLWFLPEDLTKKLRIQRQHVICVTKCVTQIRKPRLRARKRAAAMELALDAADSGNPAVGIPGIHNVVFTLAEASVVEASRAGARAAARVGSDLVQVQHEAGLVLFPPLRPTMQVEWAGGDHSGDPVTVAVQVPMNLASPDLLWVVGYSLQGKYLYAESTMIKE